MIEQIKAAAEAAFPDAMIYVAPDSEMGIGVVVHQRFGERVLMVPVTLLKTELEQSRVPDFIIAETVKAAKKSWDDALAEAGIEP